jgi:hypothetical protein
VKGPKESNEARAAARGRELGELRSAVSVERAWEDVFPSRATLLCLELGRASGGTKGQLTGSLKRPLDVQQRICSD